MNTQDLFNQALGIQPPWYVESIDFNAEDKRIDIGINFTKGTKFSFGGKEDCPPYDTKRKTWRHLNFFEHECYLHARVPRVMVDGKPKLIKTPWEGIHSGFTLLFEALLLQMAKGMPVHSIGELISENDHKIWSVIKKYVYAARKEEDFSTVRYIGEDETSQKKGHSYVTLFVDLEAKKTLFVTEGKDNSTVTRFKKDLEEHNGKTENIKKASIDMSPAFIKGTKENFPNAEIIFDHFHVTKIVNHAVDIVRRKESKEEGILKKGRYIFLKNEENFTEKEKIKFKEISMSKKNLKSMRAKHIRDNFQEIYQTATTKEDFELLLKKWYFWATHSRLTPIKKCAKTIKRHWSGVVAWAEDNITNALLEGINSIVQTVKRRARGFRNTQNFIAMIYLTTGKFSFERLNQHCQPT